VINSSYYLEVVYLVNLLLICHLGLFCFCFLFVVAAVLAKKEYIVNLYFTINIVVTIIKQQP